MQIEFHIEKTGFMNSSTITVSLKPGNWCLELLLIMLLTASRGIATCQRRGSEGKREIYFVDIAHRPPCTSQIHRMTPYPLSEDLRNKMIVQRIRIRRAKFVSPIVRFQLWVCRSLASLPEFSVGASYTRRKQSRP